MSKNLHDAKCCITGKRAVTNRFVVLILVSAALAACGPDWREYRSEAGNYSVRFPGTRTMEREVPGRASTVHITHVEVDA